MSTLHLAPSADSADSLLLTRLAQTWFVVATLGQWFFATYVTILYGGSALGGQMTVWNDHLTHGYVPGETVANTAMAAHLALAVIIHFGGPLQFVPGLQRRARSFHRWNGRIYLSVAVLASLSGLFMLWTKGSPGSALQLIGLTVDGLLILLCSGLTIYYALRRNLIRHGRWAFRLFLVVSGVWFFRIMLMFILMSFGRPIGFDPETFTGPLLVVLSFAAYLLPLAIYEFYLFGRHRASAGGRWGVAVMLALSILFTAGGIFAAAAGMWLPEL